MDELPLESKQRELLRTLPFLHFNPNDLAHKRHIWEDTALQVSSFLQSRNVGLVMKTAGGKTVIAILTALLTKGRVFFFTPTRQLTDQHGSHLATHIRGTADGVCIITGETPIRDRSWNDPNIFLTFATPQTFWNDYKRGIIDLSRISLMVFDEFHHATGNYDYIHIAYLAHVEGIKILALSASPGDERSQIEEIQRNCHLGNFLFVDVETAKRTESVVCVECTPLLHEVEKLFMSLFSELSLKLLKCGLSLNRSGIPSAHNLELLRTRINMFPRNDIFYKATSYHAIGAKLSYAYSAALTESFETFLQYGEELKNDPSKAARWIVTHPTFQKMETCVREGRDAHPKVIQCMNIISSLLRMKEKALMFIRDKRTARYLKETLQRQSVRVGTIFGGKDRNLDAQRELLIAIAEDKLDVLISTSVVEEGISVPELDAVIHYSMPLRGISRIQRNGRTGRTHCGKVIFIMLNHPLDKALYWKSVRGIHEMEYVLTNDVPQRVPQYDLFNFAS